MAVIDYQNRTFDLLTIRGATAKGVAQLSQTLFDSTSSGEVCTGIQKLAQIWVIEFLTVAGSIKFQPGRGCGFVQACLNGRLRTETDVVMAFNLAQTIIYENIKKLETDDTPLDEQFSGARLDNVVLLDDTLSLSVTIFSVAGVTQKLILPIGSVPAYIGQ